MKNTAVFLKKIMTMILVCALLYGCSNISSGAETSQIANSFSDESDSGENIYCEAGELIQTEFFCFSVTNAHIDNQYLENKSADGKQFLIVEVNIRNTSGDTLEMSVYDFQVQWDDTDQAFGYEPVDFWTAEDCLEESFSLVNDEEVQKNIIYEIPVDYQYLIIAYQEYFSDDTTGDAYFVTLSI